MQLPLWNSIVFGHDSYVRQYVLGELLKDARRWWRVNGRIVALELQGGGIVKPLEAFPDHATTESSFLGLMEHCYTRGIYRPSSYADLFYQSYKSPYLKWSHNSQFLSLFAGGWEQARTLGEIRGHFRAYDMRSAYLWSLSQGLPDPDTYRFSRRLTFSDVRGPSKQGLYVVSLKGPGNYPYPFNVSRKHYLASSDEIELYDLPVDHYHFGVSWTRTTDTAQLVDIIMSFPCPKQIARAFWGRWASHAKVETEMRTGKRWAMKNPLLNVAWAHSIVSRVKMRLWGDAVNSCHVFVDSVITDAILPTGNNVGDWRLVRDYPDGLRVLGPGIYGPIGEPLEKHAGKAA